MRLVLEMVDMGAVTGWCEQKHRPVPLCETGHPPYPPLSIRPIPGFWYVSRDRSCSRALRARAEPVFPETSPGRNW